MGEEIWLVDDNRWRGFWLAEVAAECSDHMVEDLRKDWENNERVRDDVVEESERTTKSSQATNPIPG